MFTSMKLYAYLAIAAILAGAIYHDHLGWQRAKENKARAVAAEAQAKRAAEIMATMTADAKLNQETSRALSERLAAIDRTREPVSVYCRPAPRSNPAVSAESGSADRDDGSAVNGGAAAPLRDIGAALEDVRVEALRNAERQLALQDWERKRTH